MADTLTEQGSTVPAGIARGGVWFFGGMVLMGVSWVAERAVIRFFGGS